MHMPTTLPRERHSLPRFRPGGSALALAIAIACMGPSAHAQTSSGALPSGAEPGREPLRPLLPTPGLGGAPIAVPQAAATQAPPGAQAMQFKLTQLQIDGASHYSAQSLEPLYAGLIGQTISVAQAFGVAQAIELRYRSAGFVTTRVIVPQQTIESGVFRIQVVEGFLADIAFEGDIGPARVAVERLIAPLRGVKPVNLADIERRLLLANDLAGLTVRAVLEASPTTLGGSVLRVSSQRRAREAALTLDTRSSPYLGWAQVGAAASFDALGERADRLSLNLRSSLPTDRSAMAMAGYEAWLAGDGLNLNVSASVSQSQPKLKVALDVRSQVQSGQATLSWPLVRSRQMNVRAVGQLELRDVNTDMAGVPFTRDRLRVARVGLSADRADSEWDGLSAVRITLHQGLDVLGAKAPGDPLASRARGRSEFTKLSVDLTRVQPLGARSSLVLAATGQWSADPLLASEEMALGGAAFGRGFDDGEIAADQGVAASLELRHNPGWAWAPADTQVYGFVDAGRLRAHPEGAPLLQGRSLVSAGMGVRSSVAGRGFAALELAKPINAVPHTQSNKQPRLFFKWVQPF